MDDDMLSSSRIYRAHSSAASQHSDAHQTFDMDIVDMLRCHVQMCSQVHYSVAPQITPCQALVDVRQGGSVDLSDFDSKIG